MTGTVPVLVMATGNPKQWHLGIMQHHLLVRDGTREESLEVGMDLVKLVSVGVDDIPFVPAVNKCDLDWEMSDDKISAALGDVTWFKSGAKTGENVDLAFETLALKML